ncbi:MAG: hypothetical protein E7359_03150 [Clostridiales bacterium]|nr:hypothetical protein [Clostridiales bacterium]
MFRQFFIKTFDKLEYAENFLNKGQMLFRHFSYFRNIENFRKDNNEGTAIETTNLVLSENIKTIQIGKSSNGKKFMLDVNKLKEKFPDIFEQPISFKLSYFADCNVYCITYIDSETQNKEDVLKRIQGYGTYSVVVTNCKDFIDKVKTYLHDCKFGLVKYDNISNDRSVFNKTIDYKLDNEFRIVISSGKEQNLIEVGKIQGFICTTKSLDALLQVF